MHPPPKSNSTVKYFKGDFQDPTTFFQIPLMNAVAREAAWGALLRKSPDATPSFSWRPQLLSFPHPYLQSQSLLGGVLAAFIFAALMFGFVTQVGRRNVFGVGGRLVWGNGAGMSCVACVFECVCFGLGVRVLTRVCWCV